MVHRFKTWHETVGFLLANPEAVAGTTYDARKWRYSDALTSLGYDKAHAKGLGADYKRLVLRLNQ